MTSLNENTGFAATAGGLCANDVKVIANVSRTGFGMNNGFLAIATIMLYRSERGKIERVDHWSQAAIPRP